MGCDRGCLSKLQYGARPGGSRVTKRETVTQRWPGLGRASVGLLSHGACRPLLRPRADPFAPCVPGPLLEQFEITAALGMAKPQCPRKRDDGLLRPFDIRRPDA